MTGLGLIPDVGNSKGKVLTTLYGTSGFRVAGGRLDQLPLPTTVLYDVCKLSTGVAKFPVQKHL